MSDQPTGWYQGPDGVARYWDGANWLDDKPRAKAKAQPRRRNPAPMDQSAFYARATYRLILVVVLIVAIGALLLWQQHQNNTDASNSYTDCIINGGTYKTC